MKYWNDDWRTELKEHHTDCYYRLCDCRNRKTDLVIMARLMYKYNYENFSAEDCLTRIIDWVGDWNGQFEIIDDITKDNYEKMLNIISKTIDINNLK